MKLQFLVMVALLSPTLGHADVNDECTEFWKNIWHANDRFEEHKDVKEGEKLMKLLPSDKIHSPANCDQRTETIEELSRDHKFREKLLSEGQALGYELTFRLMPLSDGSFAEELSAALAGTITKDPTKFLKYLKQEKGDVYCPKELILADKQVDISDKARAAIMKKRAEALATVADPDLAGLKADCIKQLKRKD